MESATKKKVSLFVHDLASNPIVRTYPLAVALQRLGFDVQLLGYMISGQQVYEPYRDLIDTHSIRSTGRLSDVLSSAGHLASMADGDVIYAFKPLWTSYYPALLASQMSRKKPLLLDIEDDELWFEYKGVMDFGVRHVLRGWNFAGSLKYKLLLHPLTRLSLGKTVVSRKLQKRYGGHILLHGPDETVFNPQRPELERQRCRERLGLPKSAYLLLFAGTPHPHKGLDDVVCALAQPGMERFELILAGNASHPSFQHASNVLQRRCHVLGPIENRRMPELLSAIDIIPIMQHRNGYTEAQIPAKLLEAMAMEKLVVASDVGDLPEILGRNESQPRGWTVEAENSLALAHALREIAEDPSGARCRGIAARGYFLKYASVDAIANTLRDILASI